LDLETYKLVILYVVELLPIRRFMQVKVNHGVGEVYMMDKMDTQECQQISVKWIVVVVIYIVGEKHKNIE
jgi:hypothetical protein